MCSVLGTSALESLLGLQHMHFGAVFCFSNLLISSRSYLEVDGHDDVLLHLLCRRMPSASDDPHT